jgi:uncharacterized protein (TIGR02271 family)
MAVTKRETVVGVFPNRTEAQQAVAELRRAGFRDDQIGVITQKHDESTPTVTTGAGSKAAEGAAIGAAAGAGAGALWALGIAAGIFPPLGIVAGGTLMAILASAGAGAAVASVAGALIGLGIPEEEATFYEGEVKSGRTLVTIKAGGRYDDAVAIIRRFGGYDKSTAPAAPAATTRRAEGGQSVQLKEERLHAHKEPVTTGEVRVRKEVTTEQKHIDVPVEREEVVIERRPATGAAPAGSMRAEEIRIPVREEKVHVEKEAVVVEEVDISKRKVKDTEHVAGTVRKEQLKVERQGDVDIRGDTGTTKR